MRSQEIELWPDYEVRGNGEEGGITARALAGLSTKTAKHPPAQVAGPQAVAIPGYQIDLDELWFVILSIS